jgi:hypothetical protein
MLADLSLDQRRLADYMSVQVQVFFQMTLT